MYKQEEIVPKRYPEEKPSEIGRYIFHNVQNDNWIIGFWDGNFFENHPYSRIKCGLKTIDYFIDYRLDREEIETEKTMIEIKLTINFEGETTDGNLEINSTQASKEESILAMRYWNAINQTAKALRREEKLYRKLQKENK